MKNYLLKIIILFTLFSCNNKETKYYSQYFIPQGYEGWVNVIYNVKDSPNKIIKGNDNFTYFITNNPFIFTVSDNVSPAGIYDTKFYYYSKDSLIELFDIGSTKTQIFRGALSGYAKAKKGENAVYAKNKIQYRQFYVSSKPVEKMTDINIPENTIVEDYLRKIDW